MPYVPWITKLFEDRMLWELSLVVDIIIINFISNIKVCDKCLLNERKNSIKDKYFKMLALPSFVTNWLGIAFFEQISWCNLLILSFNLL